VALEASIDADGVEELEALLEGLVQLDVSQLRRGLCPPLYQANVRYQREPRGREKWQTARKTFALHTGDCEDLAAYRAADLRVVGIQAKAIIKDIRPGLKHALVRYPDGTIEDPSRRLGMGGKG